VSFLDADDASFLRSHPRILAISQKERKEVEGENETALLDPSN
jgi:hypothetical protein